MAGRPRKFIDARYDVLDAHKAENVKVGIVGRGRPSRVQVEALASMRGISFTDETTTDELTFAVAQSRAAELAAVTELRPSSGPRKAVRRGPVTERGRKIQAGRQSAEQRRKALAIAEAMGLSGGFGTDAPKPAKRTRKAVTA